MTKQLFEKQEVSCTIQSPIGPLTLCEDDIGITAVLFADADTAISPVLSGSFIPETARQLNEYFAGMRHTFDIPLHLHGTDFQKAVWSALQAIPYGETRSYQEIALQVGNPNAARAVGMANNRNPIPVIIPCHRVVGKNRKLVGYAGGLDRKQFLFDLELQYK